MPNADARTARRLEALCARAQRDGRLPTLVAGVVRDGGLAWCQGFGLPGADADLQHRIGSITKPLTAVLVLRLREDGLLGLDDPLDRHLPGSPFGDRTVGQLLAHVGGLAAESPGPWWERTAGTDWDGMRERLDGTHVVHPAGRRFHYSNLGYGALGEVVARLRGRSWGDVLDDELLAPLEMRRTTLRPAAPAAQGYAVHPFADLLLEEPEHDHAFMAPAGQVWSTAADLARFGAFLLGDTGGVLPPDVVEEMAEPAGVDASAEQWSAYGLGLQVLRRDGRTLVGHGGSMPGFVSGLFVDAEEQTGAVVLTSATSGLGGDLLPALLRVLREEEPRVVEAWLPAAEVDADALELTGLWWWGTYGSTVRLRDGGLLDLTPLPGGGRPTRLRPVGDGTWLGLDGYHAGERMTPVRRDGEVVALDLGTFVFTRTPYDPKAPVPGGAGDWHPSP